MEKRYQVFVSSTFTDLIDERRSVMQALLELNCIPAGMELFPASTDEQWKVIQTVIDDCDYYLVILGGRYGSMDSQGVSYTEKEYDYAVQQGKPVMGFVHAHPGDIPARNTDRDSAAAAKLDAFRSKVQQRLCKFWSNADELGGAVSRSYVQLIKAYPAEGWVKNRYAKTTEDLEKVNRMHEELRVLKEELVRLRETGGGIPANLARGEDVVRIVTVTEDRPPIESAIEMTWNSVYSEVGRKCMDLPSEDEVWSAFNRFLAKVAAAPVKIAGSSFQKLKVQFFALGLIRSEMILRPGEPTYSISGSHGTGSPQPLLCWVLTEAGRCALADLLAEKRPEATASKTA